MNRSAGKLWITNDDYGIARASFEMQKPFRYMWGIVATLRQATGQFEFKRVENELWLPSSFEMQMNLRVFFRSTRRHIQQEWVEVRRLAPDDTDH